MAVLGLKSIWDGTNLRQTIEYDFGTVVHEASLQAIKKAVAEEMVKQLDESPEFQKGIRDLAAKRILKILEE